MSSAAMANATVPATEPDPAEPAVRAVRDFNDGRFDDCLARLNNLAGHTKNRRVLFNKALVEYHQSGCKNIKAFKKEIVNILGSPWPNVEPEEISSPTDAAIYYSCAVMLYQHNYFAQSRKILEKLISFKERIGDHHLASSIVLLLMEVCLCCRLPNRTIQIADQNATFFQKSNCRELANRTRLRACLMNQVKMRPPATVQSIDGLILKAHQHFVNGEINDAMLTLRQYDQFVETNHKDLWPTLNNNFSVLYSAIQKHNLSVVYMQRTIQEYTQLLKQSINDGFLHGAKDRPVYVFNLGISLLNANRPEDAFECFVEAVRHFQNNPRIWYHLADCCIKHYNKSVSQDNVFRKVGSGPHTKLIPGHINKDRYSILSESYAIPSLTLEFSGLCLKNALHLLPDKDKETDELVYLVIPSDPINFKQYNDLKSKVLLLYAFVSLKLNDPSTALEMALKLLTYSTSPVQCLLAHLYSTEALVALDKPIEALDQLNPNIIHNYTSKLNPAAKDAIGFAIWLNTAVCHTMVGDLSFARNHLHQINSPRAISLQLYLEMCAGNLENCRLLLRKFTLVNTPL